MSMAIFHRPFLSLGTQALPPICKSLLFIYAAPAPAFPLSAPTLFCSDSPLSSAQSLHLISPRSRLASPSLSADPLIKSQLGFHSRDPREPYQPLWCPRPLAPLYSVWHSVSIFVNRSRYALKERRWHMLINQSEPLITSRQIFIFFIFSSYFYFYSFYF